MHRSLKTKFFRAEELDEILVTRRVDPETIEQLVFISVGHLGGPGNPDGEDGLEFDFDDTLSWCGSLIVEVSPSVPYPNDTRDWYTIEVIRTTGKGGALTLGRMHVLWDSMVEVLMPLNQTIPYTEDGNVPEVQD